jgi:predicted DCC family thiol-disulfide oxidoreductase YuxK
MPKKIITLIKEKLIGIVEYPVSTFVIFRAFFGFYLLFYYLKSWPYAVELYSNIGITDLNWTYGIFPSVLNLFDSPLAITVIFALGTIFSTSFLLGIYPRISSLCLWYLQTCLYNRNVLADEPSQAYIGLLLITFALIPRTETIFSYFKNINLSNQKELLIPYFVFFGPIAVFAITFTISALDKATSSSWLNGNALNLLLNLEVAKPSFLLVYLYNHHQLTTWLSYSALASQFICLPLFISGFYRIALYIQFFAFCFAFMTLDINQVTIGMLLFFTFFLLQKFPASIFVDSTPKYFVLYDGFCLLCGRARKFIELFDWLGLIATINLYNEKAMSEAGLTIPNSEALLRDLHLITKDGQIYLGFYAWRKIGLLLPITFPFALLLYIPGVPYFGEKIYRLVADNRK